MTAKDFIISKLHRIINKEAIKNKKSLLVFKGFPSYFYNELYSITKSIGKRECVNSSGYIDIKLLDSAKNDLLLKFLTEDGLMWAFYEEFILLTEMVNDIKERYNGEIIIYDNNLFEKYYPLDINTNDLESFCEALDTEDINEEQQTLALSKFYSNCIKLGNKVFGVSFINRHTDENIAQTPFFELTDGYMYDTNSSDFDISSLAKDTELFVLKKKIIAGLFNESVRIVVDNNKEKQSVSALVKLLEQLNIKCSLQINDRFGDLKEDEEEKYIHILKQHWNSNSFRRLKFYKNPDISNEIIEISQGNIISDIINQCEKTLSGSDSFSDIFITAPTGAGKSLLFHIPAIYLMEKRNAVTIVVTPLIALMKDQVEQLTNERDVQGVTFINSDITPDEKEKRISKIKNGGLSIIYLSPELFLANSIESLIGDRKVGLLVVDEAHLVTTWGRDFRADYWFLGGFVEKVRKTNKFPILCLTATAVYMGTEDMVNDTLESMNLYRPKIYLGNVRRNNIVFKINNIARKDIIGGFEDFKVNKTKQAIEDFISKNIKSICYCPYTSQVEDIFQSLDNDTQKLVGKYYGSYNKFDKNDAQVKFKYGDYSVMVCTKAFGMGVDISDIEAVYHFAPTGNLADYVQEIGRVARANQIIGYAITDYTSNDLKYVRMLYGMSGMKQYQLKEMIRKLYFLYREKRNRNILISPEVFSYLFNDDDIENRVKSGLLLISKDFEQKYTFNVINVRPKSMFTKNYVCVPYEIEKIFLEEYGRFAKLIHNDMPRILPSNKQLTGDTFVTNYGKIYEVNMADLWEKHFSFYTFAQFKKKFFDGDLFNFNSDSKLSARLNLTISFENDFHSIQERLTIYTDKLINIFSHLKSKGEVFTKADFKDAFMKSFDTDIRNKELPSIILDIFVADVSKNIGFNQNAEKFKFIQERKAHNRDELVYRIMNSSFLGLSRYLSRILLQCKPINDEKSFSTFIPISNNGKKPELLYLAIILELYGLASYEVIGGKNTEIFIRINDPSKLRKLSNSNYSNSILSDIERKRKKSQEVLGEFMRKELSNEQRWDVIENYFLGKEDVVDRIFNGC